MITTGPATPGPEGRIITFYSYKGGTGRSMALANIAWILARAGKRVLVIDWDLEAPGLHRYFYPFLPDPDLGATDGLIDFLIEFSAAAMTPPDVDSDAAAKGDWFEAYANLLRYARSLRIDVPGGGFPKPGCLDLVAAGRQDATYAVRVNGFNWQNFYERLGGGVFLEAVKHRLRAEYDYILIDSRTGVSDTSGICTVQMPDDVVVCFTLNRQSLQGAAAVARSASEQRRLPDGSPGLRIWPVSMRVELAEKERLDRMRKVAQTAFKGLLPHLSEQEYDRYWGEIEILYEPFYAYEEVPATVGDHSSLTGTMLAKMVAITRYLTSGTVEQFPPYDERTRHRLLEGFVTRMVSDVPATEGAPEHLFFVSYAAQDDDRPELHRFLTDLAADVQSLSGIKDPGWFDRRRLETGVDWSDQVQRAMSGARVVVSILSPSYATSAWCAKEFDLARQWSKDVLPVIWIPGTQTPGLDRYMAPASLDDVNLFTEELPEAYRTFGLLYLIRLRQHEDDYRETVFHLARRIVDLAETRKPQTPAVQSTGDPLFGVIETLARTYEDLRRGMPPGHERTQRMEIVAAQMRAHASSAGHLLPRLAKSEFPGQRLAAAVILQVSPSPDYLEWLAERTDPRIEKPFLGYHAAVALRTAVHALTDEHLDRLAQSIEDAQRRLAGVSPDSDRVETIREAIAEIEHRLVATLQHPSEDVRRSAVSALGRLGPAAVPALTTALGDPSEDIRRHVISILGQLGPEAVPALITALGNTHKDVRRGAAAALGQIGPAAAEAIPALTGAVEDRDPDVAQAVSAALERIRSASSAVSP